jgi:apolipoprotein N-acyltransferase
MERRSIWGWLACALSGLLLVLSFAPFAWSWCGWIALTPAWSALRCCPSVQARPIRHGYVLGLVFIGGCFWWVGTATPFGLAVMLLVLSFYPALWFLLVVRLLKPVTESPLPFRLLLSYACAASAFWITLEWLRSWFLTGFNWNELGVSQVPNLFLRQFAALGGVPLLSFALVLVGIFLAEAVLALRWPDKRRLRHIGTPFFCGGAVVAVTWAYGWFHLQRHENEPPFNSVSYVCVQPNIPEIPYASGDMSVIAPREVEAFEVQKKLSLSAIASVPDLLIWPEAITTQRLMLDPLIQESVRTIEGSFHGDFLLGAEDLDGEHLYNCAYLLDPRTASIQIYRKNLLVVLGEYLPWSDNFPALRKWWGGIYFTAGNQPARFTLAESRASLAPFICYEDTQPAAANRAARLHPDFFVTLTNDGWYTGLPATWILSQHLENARLRSVEHDRSLIRCANNGISCEIDPDGEVLDRVQDATGNSTNVPGTLSRRLFLRVPQTTFYERWGDWVGVLSRWVTLAAGIFYLSRKTRKLNSGHKEL